MRDILPLLGAIALGAGCADKDFANCEYSLNGAEVCEESNVSVAFCSSDRGGEPTEVDDGTGEVTCEDLGYAIACADVCLATESATQCGDTLFYASSEEDCATAFPDGEATL